MKLTIVALTAALSLQFQSAPHYVSYTYKDADGNTVTFTSGNDASVASVEKTDKGKKVQTVIVTVPTNGGINNVFGANFDSTEEATAMGALIRAGVEAYAVASQETAKPVVI